MFPCFSSGLEPAMSSTDVNLSAAEARNYHLRSKHHMQRYAEGPGQLDWDAQPAPFRQFVGAPTATSLRTSAGSPW